MKYLFLILLFILLVPGPGLAAVPPADCPGTHYVMMQDVNGYVTLWWFADNEFACENQLTLNGVPVPMPHYSGVPGVIGYGVSGKEENHLIMAVVFGLLGLVCAGLVWYAIIKHV